MNHYSAVRHLKRGTIFSMFPGSTNRFRITSSVRTSDDKKCAVLCRDEDDLFPDEEVRYFSCDLVVFVIKTAKG